MKIGILGAGHMAEALGRHFVSAGHDVSIGGRTPSKAAAIGRRLKIDSGSLHDVARSADTLFLAVLYQGLDDTLRLAGADDGALAGKPLVDCTNPVETEAFTLVGYPEGSAAAHTAAQTGARVAKAFNLAHSDVWRRLPSYGRAAPVVPIAGDELAKRRATDLVNAVGGTAVDVGGLDQAGYLEATAALVIRQIAGGAEPTTTFQLITADQRATVGIAPRTDDDVSTVLNCSENR